MVRRASKVDQTQADIVAELRKRGCCVFLAHGVGGGFPDLVVASDKTGITALVETKTGSRGLNDLQRDFHNWWPGPIYTIRTLPEAAAIAQELSNGRLR